MAGLLQRFLRWLDNLDNRPMGTDAREIPDLPRPAWLDNPPTTDTRTVPWSVTEDRYKASRREGRCAACGGPRPWFAWGTWSHCPRCRARYCFRCGQEATVDLYSIKCRYCGHIAGAPWIWGADSTLPRPRAASRIPRHVGAG